MNKPNTKSGALLTPRAQPDPAQDGVTHINISMNGATELGKLLPHFAATPFIHPIYGPFKTMEGFWHYIKGEEPDDLYRTFSASKAKTHAKEKPTVFRDKFIEIVNEANFYRIEQTPGMRDLMVASTLPFKYYYLYGPMNVLIEPKHAGWLCAGFEEIRRLMKANQRIVEQPMIDFTRAIV